MAVAATAANHGRKRHARVKQSDISAGEKDYPVSFHLQLHLGTEFKLRNMNSVELLRSPLKSDTAERSKSTAEDEALEKAAGTKFEVLTKRYHHSTSHKSDAADSSKDETTQELAMITELLIATEKRLFIVSHSTGVDKQNQQQHDSDFWARPLESLESESLEIIDSIPLEEVEEICVGIADSKTVRPRSKWFSGNPQWFLERMSSFSTSDFSSEDVPDSTPQNGPRLEDTEAEIERKLAEMASEPEWVREYEGFLKISTTKKLFGFNGGRTYYFMVKKKSYRLSGKSSGGDAKQDSSAPSTTPGLDKKEGELEQVCHKLRTLNVKRQQAYYRHHAFRLFQANLQLIWDSLAFNFCVLILIVSNFIFTVQQLENKDPSQQPYYERIDLIYTIIFCVGNASRCPPYQLQFHIIP